MARPKINPLSVRNKTLQITVPEDFKNQVEKQAKIANLSISSYILKLILNTKVIVNNQDYRDTIIAINRVGSNINQITRSLHLEIQLETLNDKKVLTMIDDINEMVISLKEDIKNLDLKSYDD